MTDAEEFRVAIHRNDFRRIRGFLEKDPSLARLPRTDGLEPIDYLCVWHPSTADECNAALQCIDVLMEFGATPNTGRCVHGLLTHCSPGYAPTFLKALIRHGCRATTDDIVLALRQDGRQISNQNNTARIVSLLLLAGADPNGVSVISMPANTCVMLPLHYAVARRNAAAVFALLEFGADPYRRDPVTSLSALDWARHVAAFPSRAEDIVAQRILRVFQDLQQCLETHEATFPQLKKELMEHVWNPVRLATRGYFDV